jgi:hypothetical protein
MQPPHNPNDQNDRSSSSADTSDNMNIWLADLVSGKSRQDAGDVPLHVVHQTLKANDAKESAAEAMQSDSDWQRLQFALRREQIEADKARKEREAKSWFANPAKRNMAMAAAVAAVVGLGAVFGPGSPVPGGTSSGIIDPSVQRGVKTELIRSTNPTATAQSWVQEIRAAGGQAQLRSADGKVFVDVALQRPIPKAMIELFEKRAVPLPETGNLMLQFME